MNVMDVARKIGDKIRELEFLRRDFEKLAIEKARTMGVYDRDLRIATLRLKDEGKLPATLIEKVAKGDCYKQRSNADLAEALYKIQIVKAQMVQAELNGYQSIFRHLDEK